MSDLHSQLADRGSVQQGWWVVVALPVIVVVVVVNSNRWQEEVASGRPLQVQESEGLSMDHSAFGALLGKYVRQGRVDYTGLKTEAHRLDAYLHMLSKADIDAMGRDEQLALFINAYNACTLKLILEHYPGINSIKDIPRSKRWEAKRWLVGGQTLSLDAIEHQILRKELGEPRIHFAIVCASISCPPLRDEAYVADKLEEQLTRQAQWFNRDPQHLRWDQDTDTLYISAIYDWFSEDFEKGAGSVLDFILQYANPDVAQQLQLLRSKLRIKYLDYDWKLNDIKT